MRLGTRFVTAIYPFQYAPELCLRGTRRPKRRLEGLSERWLPWWCRLDEQGIREAITDGSFFLPYVRKLLYPEADLLSSEGLEEQVREVLQVCTRTNLDDLFSRLSAARVVRLTLQSSMLKPLSKMTFRTEGEHARSWPVSLSWVDLLLFPQRVGFLLLHLRPGRRSEDIGSWAAFLDALAMVHQPFLEWRLPEWELVDGEPLHGVTNQVLVDFLLQGWTDTRESEMVRDLGDLSSERDASFRYTASDLGQVYGARFHLHAFSCVQGGEERGGDNGKAPDPLFESAFEAALLHMGTGLAPVCDPGRPHPKRLDELRQRNFLAIWDNWQGLVLPDRILFLGTRCTRFTETALPRNVRSEYLVLHLLTLFQKIRLSLMNGELLRGDKTSREHRRQSQLLWDAFITFQNHYWYSEVTPLEQGKLLYASFQEGLDVRALYEQMGEEVHQIRQYYVHRGERRVQGILNFLTFVGFPLGLWITLLGPTLFAPAETQLQATWPLALGGLAVFCVVTLPLWLWWLRRP